MRSIFQFYKNQSGKIAALLTFSFFVSGCHTGMEPAQVSNITEKKEAAGRDADSLTRNITKSGTKPAAKNSTKQKRPVSFTHNSIQKKNTITQLDPFAVPTVLQERQTPRTVPQKERKDQSTPVNSPELCVAGIFDNGKEKYALVRWKQIQGIFRCGEQLGNGYYVKEITADSVLLAQEQAFYGTNTVKLKLQ